MIRKMTALSLAGLVAFIACKKNDNPTPKPPVTVIPDSVSIIGKWLPIRNATYFYSPAGQLLDSSATDLSGDRDYYDFEKGGVFYFHEDDGNSAYPFTDTSSYRFYNTKYIIVSGNDGTDTAQYKLTLNTKDTLTLMTNTFDDINYGFPVYVRDTIVLIK